MKHQPKYAKYGIALLFSTDLVRFPWSFLYTLRERSGSAQKLCVISSVQVDYTVSVFPDQLFAR